MDRRFARQPQSQLGCTADPRTGQNAVGGSAGPPAEQGHAQIRQPSGIEDGDTPRTRVSARIGMTIGLATAAVPGARSAPSTAGVPDWVTDTGGGRNESETETS